jgi:deoxynucleoside triphosphate triphosphohydrolase SAMHD1
MLCIYLTIFKFKAVELMLVDALVKAENYLKISSYPLDPAEYWKVCYLCFSHLKSNIMESILMACEFYQLDDTVIKSIETSHKKQLKESRDILMRIRRRDLYRVCNFSHLSVNLVLRFRICTQVLVYNNK